METRRWADIKSKGKSPERMAKIERDVQEMLDVMTLRELREAAGKTQVEVAELADKTQAQLSRIESRKDHRLSTLRTYVEALGGELEVVAKIAGKSVRLTNI